MSTSQRKRPEKAPAAAPVPSHASTPPPPDKARPREVGGVPGPDPTRFGDWEKNGRCIDF